MGWYISVKLRDRPKGWPDRKENVVERKQGPPLLPVISNQHQAQAGSRERVEISGRKYDPALTQTERVL